MEAHKILIFIVAYNAEKHIDKVLERISKSLPDIQNSEFAKIDYEILIIDDASKDNTVKVAESYKESHNLNLTILKNPVNQGYGGNQKIGYQYAVKFGFDSVVLLHGDNQYPPESIKDIISELITAPADIVLGSRMLDKKSALKGKMPLYKFIGNIVLTKTQNYLLGTNLAEFHTGFKGYRTSFLKNIPFSYNSNDFDFDTDIIIQAALSGARIAEIAIPTHYGEEVCNVNGIKYAIQVVRNSFLAKVQKYSIYYHPKFDFEPEVRYESKTSFDSSHTFAINNVNMHANVLDIGGASGFVAEALKNDKKCKVYGLDKYPTKTTSENYNKFIEFDLDNDNISDAIDLDENIDTILLLDVIEHLINPESFLINLRNCIAKSNPKIVVTTGNIGFIIIRLSLLLGNFTYGKRGILDFTHKRLFTFYSLKRLLKLHGYSIEKVEGVPVPFEFIFKNKKVGGFFSKVNRILIKISKSLFSFQIAMVVKPLPTLDILLERAKNINKK
jgi:glycosyltransferase involved in cell wall biosynthesis